MMKLKQWGFALGLLLMGVAACKTSTKVKGGLSSNDEQQNSPAKDTSSPLSGLGSISANTSTVEEKASGMEAALPFDESIRTGQLENGMRYYLRKNAKPENRIELRLAIDAGSMQEEDSQRGLAHFVEHMCFNGTANFKKNELVDFLEKTGVRFGADLNAYTSFDETVYMLQLPTDKEGLVDKGLVVMQDWASAVSFEEEEIDKERGVILSEWRTRLGADERMRQVYWPKLFYNSRYANRLPIGTTEVIQNAPYERLTTFYKDWYRPNLMALIVVGDIDLDEIEAKIKTNFSKMENPENPKEKKLFEVPGHKETFVSVATDKEATNVSFQMIHKHAPKSIKTLDDFRTSITHQLYNIMLNARYKELSQDPKAPFLYAGSGYGNYVRNSDAYFIQAAAKENSIEEAIALVLREQKRVLEHGFTDTELERAKAEYLNYVEQAYRKRDKVTSASIAGECVSHFLQDAPLFGIEKELQLVKEFLPSIKLKEMNALPKAWITKENRTAILTAPAKDGLKIPTEDRIRELLAENEKIEVEAYKDKFLDMPLLEKAPKAGKVTAQKEVKEKELNITEWTLSNGAKVILKPTDFEGDQIMLQAYSPGGHSIYDVKDFLTASSAAELIDRSGVGQFDLIALEKKLTAKTVSISPYISELSEGFSGRSSTADFETMLKLLYLYATQSRLDKNAYEAYLEEAIEQSRNALSNPQQYFFNEYQKALSQNHPRRPGLLSEEQIRSIDMKRAHEIYKERFADFSDFTFVLVGNFKPEEIKGQVEQYIASLPSTNRKENYKDPKVKFPTKGMTKNLKKGLAPQSNVILSFAQEVNWSAQEAFKLDAAISVLSIMVRENLREDKGGVYSPFVGGGMSREPNGTSQIIVFFQCAPDDVEVLVEAVKEEVAKLQKDGPSEENLEKVRETKRRGLETSLKENRFWLGQLLNKYRFNENPLSIFDKEKMIEDLKADDIKKAINQYADIEKALILTIKPEKEVDNERP